MRVLLGQATPIRLEDRDLLGVGGEARVYAHGDSAIKIYHVAEATGDAGDRLLASQRLARNGRMSSPTPWCIPDKPVNFPASDTCRKFVSSRAPDQRASYSLR